MTVVASEKTAPPKSFELLNIVHKKNGKTLYSYPYSHAVFPRAYVRRDIGRSKSVIRSIL